MKPWTVLERRTLLDRPWMKLRVDRVRTARDHELPEYHVIECADWACTVCVTPELELVLVEQYRHGVGRTTLELPAGALERGEAAEVAARRELEEETGFRAERWTSLGSFTPETTRHQHRAHLFLAEGATRVAAQRLDAAEDVTVRCRALQDAEHLITGGEIEHAVHVAALLLALKRLG